MMGEHRFLLPDRLWKGNSWKSGEGIEVSSDGEILDIRKPEKKDRIETLSGRAFLPGFVNAHSHAFQRALRGRTQTRSEQNPQDDFWTWREQMYRVVESLTPSSLQAITAMCQMEMMKAGWTSVAEFHYLHHLGEDPILDATALSGIRTTLIRVAYFRAGFEQSPSPGQKNFMEFPDTFFAHCRALKKKVSANPLLHWGSGIHSLRAVDREQARDVRDFAQEEKVPFHMHVAEQPREVEECWNEHGMGPGRFLEEMEIPGKATTLVHGNHFTPNEFDTLMHTGATICICPSTESDLGDGLYATGECWNRNIPISLGSDSHTLLDPFAELRALEYLERSAHRRRICIEPVEELLRIGSEAGSSAMGIPLGKLEEGYPADIIAIDLHHDTLTGTTEESLLPSILLSGSPNLVRDVWIGGERVITDRTHKEEELIRDNFTTTMENLWK
jgi:formimidoylglutamate deiminase